MAGRGKGWDDDAGKQKKRASKRKNNWSMPRIRLPLWMEWYDMIMIPLLVAAGIWILCNFERVIMIFLGITLTILDMLMVVILIALIVLILWLWFGRGRGGRRRYF